MNEDTNVVKENKKVGVYTIIGIIAIAVVCVGITYAYWILTRQQQGVNTVNTACLSIKLINEQDEINLQSAYPISDDDGLKLKPFKFTIENKCTKKAEYSLNLEMLDETTLSSNYVRMAINEVGAVSQPTTLSSYSSYDEMKISGTKEGRYIFSGILEANESKNYELRLWLSSVVGPSDDANNKYYASKIVIDSKIEYPTITKCQNTADSDECKLLNNENNKGTNSLIYDGTSDDNLRYTGTNPDNYVRFNNEIWRIIGFMKVKTDTGNTESRIKIIRQDGVGSQKDFGVYNWDSSVISGPSLSIDAFYNDWTTATLKEMLNGIYYESTTGECFKTTLSATSCDFTGTGSEPKGLDATAKGMIDKDVIWNLGGWKDANLTAAEMYQNERGTTTGDHNNYPQLWTKDNDATYHKGVALMYPSDYGFAVGGKVRNECLTKTLYSWWNSSSSTNECGSNDWLKPSSKNQLTLTPQSSTSSHVLIVTYNGNVNTTSGASGNMNSVWPVVYLNKNVKIVSDNTHNGSLEQPYDLTLN